tara:strand:+ start:386 stop:838 length:453 start_codon:yes stop_codon:yes gene_type:complete
MANEKKLMDEMRKFIPKFKQHGQYQMSLSSLIKALQRERVGLLVKITDKHYPGRSHSYYGYHTDLAFEPTEDPITVAEFLKECQDSVGKSFITADHANEFYKDHVMQINAPVWISTLGQASQKGIVDLVPTDGYIKLVTKSIEEEEDGAE